MLPSCREALMGGFRVIFAGNGEAPPGLCPPHAGRSENKDIVRPTNANRTQRNLPMHPLVTRSKCAGEPLVSRTGIRMENLCSVEA